MKNIPKWLGWSLAGIVGIVVSVFVVLKLIPNTTYQGWVTDAVRSATGRELSFQEFDLDIGARVGLSAVGVSFSNADWASRPNLLSINEVDLELRLLPLARGVVDFSLAIDEPDILLETSEEGIGNWVFSEALSETVAASNGAESDRVELAASSTGEGTPSVPIKPYIRNLQVEGLSFAYNDTVLVRQLNAAVDVLSLSVEGDELLMDLNAVYQGIALSLEGVLGNVNDMYEFTFAPLDVLASINDSIEVSIAGSAGPLMPSSDLKMNLNINGELDSLASLEPFLALAAKPEITDGDVVVEENKPLPDSGPWTANIKAVAEGGWPGPVSLNTRVEVDQIFATADAIVSTDSGELSAKLDIGIDAPSTSAIGEVLGLELPERAPVIVRSGLSARSAKFALDELDIRLGEGRIIGSASYAIPDVGNPMAIARLDITDIDLTPLPPKETIDEEEVVIEDESAEGYVAKEQPAKKGTRLFSNEKFGTGGLRRINADIQVNATNLMSGPGAIPTAKMSLLLNDGLLKIEPLHIDGAGRGALDGKITVDATQRELSSLEVFIDANNFATPSGGDMDIDIDAVGEGDSVASLLGGLNGQFIVSLTDMDINSSFLARLGNGLGNLNPFASRATRLECAVVRMDVVDGQVDFEDKVVAMLTDSTIMGTGVVDLKTEAVEAGVNIKPRKVAGSIVDLGLSGLISVAGTLAEPSVRLNASDMALKYASYSAYIATGGLSWLVEESGRAS